MDTSHTYRPHRGNGDRYEYEHAFVQHLAGAPEGSAIPLDVSDGLNAWGADGWDVVHMEAVWVWQHGAEGACWPESLRGYYVTFRRQSETQAATALAEAEAVAAEELPL